MELKLYRGLTYLLALPNAFLALMTIIGLFFSLVNPVMLFGMTLFVGTVLYAIYSFIFLQKGIVANQKCTMKLRRNLKFSSVLSLLFCVMNLINCITILSNKSGVDMIIAKLFEENKNLSQANLTPEMMGSYLTGTIYGLGIYAALLLLHTLMTYKFTKLYADTFVDPRQQV